MTLEQATGRLNFLVISRPAPWTVRLGSASPAMASRTGTGQGPGQQTCPQPTPCPPAPGCSPGREEAAATRVLDLGGVQHPQPRTSTRGSHGLTRCCPTGSPAATPPQVHCDGCPTPILPHRATPTGFSYPPARGSPPTAPQSPRLVVTVMAPALWHPQRGFVPPMALPRAWACRRGPQRPMGAVGVMGGP